MSLDSLPLARLCRDLALDKKALDPVILDLREVSAIADYFVICSAQSEPQLKAIAISIEKTVKDEQDRRPYAVDGFSTSQWIVVDYGDVMVHLFHEAKRAHYALEELWGDAPQIN